MKKYENISRNVLTNGVVIDIIKSTKENRKQNDRGQVVRRMKSTEREVRTT